MLFRVTHSERRAYPGEKTSHDLASINRTIYDSWRQGEAVIINMQNHRGAPVVLFIYSGHHSLGR